MNQLSNKNVRMRQKKYDKPKGGNRLSRLFGNVKLFKGKDNLSKDSTEATSPELPSMSNVESQSSIFEEKDYKEEADTDVKVVEKEEEEIELIAQHLGNNEELKDDLFQTEHLNLQEEPKHEGEEPDQPINQEKQKDEVLETEHTSEEATPKMDVDKRSKPTRSRVRQDYVEMWNCNSGDQVSIGTVYDAESGNVVSPSIDANNEEEDKLQRYNSNNMKDGFRTRNFTIAGSDVKLRHSPKSRKRNNNRVTWPASGEHKDEELNADGEGSLNDQTNRLSADLSDQDTGHLSDSQQSISSREDSVGSLADNPVQATLNAVDTSPLRRFRRAQTTTERMSVAFSAFSEGSDEDQVTPDSASLMSARSIETPSSEDDGHTSEEDTKSAIPPSTAPIKNRGVSPVFDFSRPKSADMDNRSDDSITGNKRNSATSFDNVDGIFPSSPKDEAISGMVDYQKVRSIAEAEKLRMRRWVLTSVLDNEETYLEYLNTLLLYMKPLKATIGTSQPVMSGQEFDTLFYRVPELHQLHTEFYKKLKPRLEEWKVDTKVGDLFKELLSKISLYGDYLNNYKRAQHTVEKCAKENQQFAQLIESLKVQSSGTKGSESISLIEMLYKPAERVIRTTLVLRDLLKHTPHRHSDYQILRLVLKESQHFLDRINSSSTSAFKARRIQSSAAAAARSADRELKQDGYLVEIASDGSRKLRHCFLFSDLLLCAKQSSPSVFHSKDSYECKWYIPLADLSFQPTEDSEVMPEIPLTSEEDLREMSGRAQQLKKEIAHERKKIQKKVGSDNVTGKSKTEERMRKKLAEQEARIVLAAPDLPLRMYHLQGKSYMFLMSSDYERTEWLDAIVKLQESCFKSFTLNSYELNMLLSTCTKHKKMSNISSMLMKEEEDLLSGYLNVTIHSGQGFLRACNPYCTLEVDSYGQFQTKAKTRVCQATKTPTWDEEFELDLDGALTMRVLCYDKATNACASGATGVNCDVLIAKGKVGLMKGSLRNKKECIEEIVTMNEVTVKVCIKFTPREKNLQRILSKKSNGVFGVKLTNVAKRDSSGIPAIVRKCVAEIERRGMDEVGIYRVSGVASEIKALKASFDSNRKDVESLLRQSDINAVAGVLKLYFRELPEPVFTDSRYNNFIEASSLKDPDTKRQTMTCLLADLPQSNYKTLHFLRNHLLRVASKEQENKMSLHNLATVFGPTLLRPAEDKTPQPSAAAFSLNALRMDVHLQMDVLLFFLGLEEMVDYDTLIKKRNSKKGNANIENLLGIDTLSENNRSNYNESETSQTSPLPPSKTGEKIAFSPVGFPPVQAKTPLPPSSQRRTHQYEEICLPAFNSRPQFVRPPVGR